MTLRETGAHAGGDQDLPATPGGAGRSTTPLPLPRSGRLDVLVADDDVLMRVVTATVVAAVPGLHLVDEAADAAEAVRRTLARLPDLLVLDHDLGDADASLVVPQVRCGSPATRILLSSGRHDVHALGAALGVEGVVAKVDGPGVLRKALVALQARALQARALQTGT